MTFETSTWVFTAFITLYGILFLYLGFKANPSEKLMIFNVRTVFFLFGLGYIFIAHFGLLMSYAYSIEYTNLAPCENIVVNSTAITASITEYGYDDSCAGRTVPESQNSLLTFWSWLMWGEVFAIAGGCMLLFFRMVFRKW